MRAFLLAAFAGFFCVASTGCATIMTGAGPNQTVKIASNPRGARVFVDGEYKGLAPIGVPMTRGDDHVLRLEMDGYAPMTRDIKTGYNPWHLGNLILGGVVGITIDLLDGSFLWLGGGINERLARVQSPDGMTEPTGLTLAGRAPSVGDRRAGKSPPPAVAPTAPPAAGTYTSAAAPAVKPSPAGTQRSAQGYNGEPSRLPPRRQAAQ